MLKQDYKSKIGLGRNFFFLFIGPIEEEMVRIKHFNRI